MSEFEGKWCLFCSLLILSPSLPRCKVKLKFIWWQNTKSIWDLISRRHGSHRCFSKRQPFRPLLRLSKHPFSSFYSISNNEEKKILQNYSKSNTLNFPVSFVAFVFCHFSSKQMRKKSKKKATTTKQCHWTIYIFFCLLFLFSHLFFGVHHHFSLSFHMFGTETLMSRFFFVPFNNRICIKKICVFNFFLFFSFSFLFEFFSLSTLKHEVNFIDKNGLKRKKFGLLFFSILLHNFPFR